MNDVQPINESRLSWIDGTNDHIRTIYIRVGWSIVRASELPAKRFDHKVCCPASNVYHLSDEYYAEPYNSR